MRQEAMAVQGNSSWRRELNVTEHRSSHNMGSVRRWKRSLAVIAVALMWGITSFSVIHHNGGVASAETTGVPYVVHRGDTLWNIALKTSGAGVDTRTVVLQIMQMNHMKNAQIYAGEHLVLPNNAK
ncbi:LysM peptidoglycan-binding domain-containing protein [Alicyclobacillus ferrooxydans]|uniref:LysM domain-containing protein n=1 Tax=Alicyclobacillus ferrooxydans TaxID=471514 RepID=A0A0P9C3N9_9BACL|nr:LysM peptidoglycan-binding domain-containing protein [Alicyclobacillus ferrooxydans]KPV39343.1 hypothetical protein AN477_22920 [Alicyclobacillus ferrooxydans]